MIFHSIHHYFDNFEEILLRIYVLFCSDIFFRIQRKDIFVPVHVYGQLAQHETGAQFLANLPYLKDVFGLLRSTEKMTDSVIKHMKAALWAVVCIAILLKWCLIHCCLV